MKWPDMLNGHKLFEHEDGYAYYFLESGLGFALAMSISTIRHRDDRRKILVEIRFLSGNSWGRYEDKDGNMKPRTTEDPRTMTWMLCRTEYLSTERRALDYLRGKKETPKGKRKPRPIEPMSNLEIRAWLGETWAKECMKDGELE